MKIEGDANIGGDIHVNIGNSADEIVAKVIAALDPRGNTAKAAEAGLERQTILKLARRLKPGEIIDFDQAVKELENAIGIALDVIAKGERGTNHEAFVGDVLKRLAETTKKGDFDAGAKTVDDALAALDRQDEEHRQFSLRSRETLLEAGIEQDLLRRDPAAVARRIEAIAAMDKTDENPAWSRKYKERWSAFYAEGEEKGINLSFEVAIAMARRMLGSIDNGDQRGIALISLGNALACLGERESETMLLEEAIFAYRQALQVYARERMPIEWAMTQMNLGSALHALGTALHALSVEESWKERLKEAVAAHHEALQVNTRKELPLEWAKTMMNLGNTLERLGEWEGGTVWLGQAIAAYREALEENTRERVPLEWAKTKMNLGIALAKLDERQMGTASLEEAVTAYHEVLQVVTRESMPIPWAMTQNNLGLALAMLGERESCTTLLEEAIVAYRESLDENTRERRPFLWAKTQENLAAVYLAHFYQLRQPCQLDAALESVNGALEEFRKAKSQFFIEKAEGLREAILAAKNNL